MVPDPMRRPAAALMLTIQLLAATGCHSWQAQQGGAAALVEPVPVTATPREPGVNNPMVNASMPSRTTSDTPKPETVKLVRITTSDGSSSVLRVPRVANDSLYGKLEKDGSERAFALQAVSQVETRKVSAGKTVGLVVGLAGALFVGVMAAALIDCGTSDTIGC